MWFRTRSYILVGLFVLLQSNVGAEKLSEDLYEGNEGIFQLQKCVERLIEKILNIVEDFYAKIRNKYKCIPDEVPDTVMEILKHSIDCVDEIEKKLQGRRVTKTIHRKLFHRCLAHGRKQVHDLMNSIDPTLNHCPENMTEKTYQINITTSFMKTFNINIKNGLEITRKIIYFGNHTLYGDEEEENSEDGKEEYLTRKSDDGEYLAYEQYGEEEYVGDETDPKVSSKSKETQHNRNSSTSVEKTRRKRNK